MVLVYHEKCWRRQRDEDMMKEEVRHMVTGDLTQFICNPLKSQR